MLKAIAREGQDSFWRKSTEHGCLMIFELYKKITGLTHFKTQYSRPLPLIIALARLSRPDIIVASRTI